MTHDEFARPLPIAEDDPALQIERIEIRRPDTVLPAYAAAPKNAAAHTPGLVVVMHAWGLDDFLRELVRRFAKTGFAAIAPDLYSRHGIAAADRAADAAVYAEHAQKLQGKQVDSDLRASALWLQARRPGTKTGIAGFSVGGTFALRQAVDNDDVFAAAAVWCASVSGIEPSRIHLPLIGSFGERDMMVAPDSVRAFRKALRVPNDLVIYPTAAQGFFDDHRNAYVAPAAGDAWRRAVAFFGKYLRT